MCGVFMSVKLMHAVRVVANRGGRAAGALHRQARWPDKAPLGAFSAGQTRWSKTARGPFDINNHAR